MVADGYAHKEIDGWHCRHIILPTCHKDNGNTPRGIGSLCAMNEGFQSILFLDADNWYDPRHAEVVDNTHSQENCDVVFARRHIVFPDGDILLEEDWEDRDLSHVDTSCFAIYSNAFSALSTWCSMPQRISFICDRIMFQLLVNKFSCCWTESKTVFFETYYPHHFRKGGKTLPETYRRLPRITTADVDAINEEFAHRSFCPVFLPGGRIQSID